MKIRILPILALVIPAVVAWNIYISQVKNPDPLTDISIDSSGRAFQDDQRVGVFKDLGDKRAELKLPLGQGAGDEYTFASFYINLPEPISKGEIKITFDSIQGQSGLNAEIIDTKTILVSADGILKDGKVFITINTPSDYISIPFSERMYQKLIHIPDWNWYLLSVIVIFTTIIYCLMVTKKPSISAADRREYPPARLSPLEIAILTRGSFSARDLSALIFQLAERGHIAIITSDNNTYINRLYKVATTADFERSILDLIAPTSTRPGTLSEVLANMRKELFNDAISTMYLRTYDSLTDNDVFYENPRDLHLRFKTTGILWQVTSIAGALATFFLLRNQLPGLLALSLAGYTVGYLIYQTGYHITPLNSRGKELLWQTLEFRNYLSEIKNIEKNGIQGQLFYHFLPYALVLGCEQNWFARFANTNFMIPEWFTISDQELYSPLDFFARLQRITDEIADIAINLKDPNVD